MAFITQVKQMFSLEGEILCVNASKRNRIRVYLLFLNSGLCVGISTFAISLLQELNVRDTQFAYAALVARHRCAFVHVLRYLLAVVLPSLSAQF